MTNSNQLPPGATDAVAVDDILAALDDILGGAEPELAQRQRNAPTKAARLPDEADAVLGDTADVAHEVALDERDFDVVPDGDQNGVVGRTIGSYRILELLSSGGMGSVYIAEHRHLECKFAVKVLHPELVGDPSLVERFFAEARMVSQIRHDHIVEITDFVSEGSDKCLAMELLQGRTIFEELEVHRALPLPRVLDIASQLCDALEAVHAADIAHRDIKPKNVMLIERQDTRDFVKLLDFGIAKLRDPQLFRSPESIAGQFLGTPGYMAPEQLFAQGVDSRCDIYALGALLFEMLAGQQPFVADSWPALLVQHATEPPPKLSDVTASTGVATLVPPELDVLVAHCLEKSPEQRPQTMTEVKGRLRAIAATPQISRPIRRAAAAARWLGQQDRASTVTRRRVGAASGIAVAAAGVLLAVTAFLSSGDPPPQARPTVGSAAMGAHAVAPVDSLEPVVAPPHPTAPQAPPEVSAPQHSPAPQTHSKSSSAKPVRHLGKTRRQRAEKVAAAAGRRSAGAQRARVSHTGAELHQATATLAPTAPMERRASSTPEPASEVSDAQRRYLAGVGLLKQNKALLAVQEFNQCLSVDPGHAHALRQLGRAYIRLGFEAKAIIAFERFVALAPNANETEKLRKVISAYRGL